MSNSTLKEIIKLKNQEPKIINPDSNFVVVTYWWGRGNLNQNTARPCISFFEQITQQVIKLCVNTLNTASKNNINNIPSIYKKDLSKIISELPEFNKIMEKKANDYVGMIYDYVGLQNNEYDKDNKTLQFLEKLKQTGKTPQDYEFKNKEYTMKIFKLIMKEMINKVKDYIFRLFILQNDLNNLKAEFMNNRENLSKEDKEKIKSKIVSFEINKKNLNNDIKKILNTPQTYSNDEFNASFQNKSIYQILHLELRFLSPLKYEDMINKWENECEKYKCNHLAIEYPEFARPGGYQMAINAKPLFIKKALELCQGRSILYIDGDMFIRKYPMIFDLKDVDFMARGWWIDPRSSYKMDESIMYDPYTFETSGGTMFFAQSRESKMLIEKWIEESDKSYQQGKADDRILSLVFNTYKFVLSMKVIQLPIEYLWLSLDYDERLLEMIYDYNRPQMMDSIIIEHPECLTSEDTASSSGASSDRTPKFYQFLEENLVPVSEETHEFLNFPNKEMTSAFKNYYDYMNNATYIDDGNEELYKKGFVNKENPAENEQPLYVIPYDHKYGNKVVLQENDDETGEIVKYTKNDIHDLNINRAKNMNVQGLNLNNIQNGVIEVTNTSVAKQNELISLIIRLLMDGNDVIYNPTTMNGYNAAYYNNLITNPIYANLDVVFVPDDSESVNYNDFYKQKIFLNQPIKFSHNNPLLVEYLSMFLSLDEFSNFIHYGSYEFISRLRVGYLKKVSPGLQKGGDGNEDEQKYLEGLEIMYNNSMGILGGKRRKSQFKLKTKKHRKHGTQKIKKNKGKRTTRRHKMKSKYSKKRM
jgi:hypothetical protein